MIRYIVITLLATISSLQATPAAADETTSQQQREEQPTGKYKDFKKLTEDEIAAFFKVYKEDPEPHTKGGFPRGWIVGEAPRIQDEPLAHFPTKGRLTARGLLSFGKAGVTFTTDIRSYQISDRFFVHQLSELGFSKKNAPRAATIDAYWVNLEKTTGYTLLYSRSIKLH